MNSRGRPNVLVFLTDQQRHDTTGVHGCPLGLTPNFDRFARNGTLVDQSFTCQPVCGPARACLQTGLYATQTGVWRNGFRPHPDLRTIAQHFNDAGYDTAYLGKWHLGSSAHIGPVPKEEQGGYRHWLGANVLEFVSDAYNTRLWDSEGREHRLPGYRVDALTDAAIRHIDTVAAEPFFMMVSYLEPHHQNSRDDYPAPVGYAESLASAWMPPDLHVPRGSALGHWPGYCGMIKRLDEAFGRLLDALRSRGQLDNTIILYTSDHGNHFKTRNAEYKRSCHEASIRVPTALGGPGFEGGGRFDGLTSLVDLTPTLLDAAGIAIPSNMVGRSIKTYREKRLPAWGDDIFVQISESQTGRCIRTKRWKYSVRCPEDNADGTPVSRPSADTYIDDCLYDLKADPWELANLVGFPSHADVVRVMRARLIRRMQMAGEEVPAFIDAPTRASYEHVVSAEETAQ